MPIISFVLVSRLVYCRVKTSALVLQSLLLPSPFSRPFFAYWVFLKFLKDWNLNSFFSFQDFEISHYTGEFSLIFRLPYIKSEN